MNERFNEQQKEVLHFLKLLDDNNVLDHVIVTGSWAEYVYAQGGVLPGYNLTLRTIDMDFLVKNMRKPAEPVSIPMIAKSNGYSISHDLLLDTTKIFSPGGLEIEFLISQMGQGDTDILKTNLGVNAQALRHMEGLVRHTLTVDLLGLKVQVPCPEMYVLHKIIINPDRKPEKQEKDRHSVTRLLPYISFDKLNLLYDELTKKEKKRVREFFENYKEEVCGELRIDMQIKMAEFLAIVRLEPKRSQGPDLSL